MQKEDIPICSRKAGWLRYLLSVIALSLVILHVAHYSSSLANNYYGKTSFSVSEPATESEAYEYPMYDVIMAFGDSITQLGYEQETGGWVSQLSDMYVRRMDVLNRGFSGFNTTRAKHTAHVVFPLRRDHEDNPVLAKFRLVVSSWVSWVAEIARKVYNPWKYTQNISMWPRNDPPFPKFYPKVQLCIFFFGANDAADPRDDRYTPLEEYPDNLKYIINLLRDPNSAHYSPDTRILMVTPPAVGDKMSEEYFRRFGWTYGPHNNKVTQKYAEAAISVAKSLEIPYVDMWTAIEQRVQESRKRRQAEPCEDNGYDGYDEFLSDGLHLNAKGNQLLFRALAGTIERNWPELCPHGTQARAPKSNQRNQVETHA